MKGKAAILIISHKEKLSQYEKISLRQCIKVLGKYPIFFICPEGLNTEDYDEFLNSAKFDFIAPKWQSTYKNFNRLKIEPFLYKRYSKFQYILYYEPDAFVFKDDLDHWMKQGYDYVGAPWFEGWSKAEEGAPFSGVGNGGFSLRNVQSALKVLNRFSYIKSPKEVIRNHLNSNESNPLKKLYRILKNLTVSNNTFHLFNDFPKHEDLFWGYYANRNFGWFKVPSPEEALLFGMEMYPSRTFELNNNQLPFGCHAWWRYDLDFWRPFIEAEGHDLSFSDVLNAPHS